MKYNRIFIKSIILILSISFFQTDALFSQPVSKKTELYVEAYKLMEAKDYQNAINYYEWILAIDRTEFQANLKIAVAESMLGNEKEAIEQYAKALVYTNSSDDSLKVYYNRAISYSNNKQTIKAIEDYSRSIKLDDKFAYAYNNRALAKEKIRDLKGAKSDFNIAIHLDSNNASFLYNLGLLHLHKKKFKLAAFIFTKCLEKNPRFGDAYLKRGDCLAQLKKFLPAFADFNIYLQSNKKNHEAYLKRGYCNLALKFYEKACEDFKTSQELGNKTAPQLIEQFCNRK